MKKTILIASVIIAIVIISAILGVILTQNTGTTKTKGIIKNIPVDTQATSPSPSSTNTPTSAKTYSIEISGFAFSPATLNIKKGDKVIWTNQDSVAHTVTSDTGNQLDSGLLSKSETYTHAFDSLGTYSYHCTPHPYMKARIIVE